MTQDKRYEFLSHNRENLVRLVNPVPALAAKGIVKLVLLLSGFVGKRVNLK